MGLGEGVGGGTGASRGKQERLAVPAMPMPIAVLLCILNFLVPGLGTILAGFSTFCCARNEDMSATKRVGSCCISFAIGLLQLATTALLLIGWIWSCVWGVFFLGMSSEYYHDNPPDRDGGRVITTQGPQVTVVTQPAAAGYQYPAGSSYQHQPQQQPGMHPGGQYPPPQHGQYPPAQQGQYPPHQPYGQPQMPPGPGQYPGGYELPPPYTETDQNVTPSAPPAEKVLQH